MNNSFDTDRLAQATAAILEAVDRAARHDDRLAGRMPTEILAAIIAAASLVAHPMAGNDPMPLEAELQFARTARIVARSGSTVVAVFLLRMAQALIEPREAESSLMN